MRTSSARPLIAGLMASIALGWTAPASAAVIVTIAEADWGAPGVIDLQGPATAGTLVSSASGAGGQADAILDVTGDGAVRLDGAIANGQLGNALRATTQWLETISNVDTVVRAYRAELTIPEIQLFFSGSGFHGVPQEQRTVSYRIDLFAGDEVVWSSIAELRSGAAGHVLFESGTDLGGVKSPVGLRYSFAPSSHTVPLGLVAPSESLNVSLELSVSADIPGFEILTDASIGDPFGLERAEITLVDLPEPGTGAMLVVGATALACSGRSRRSGRSLGLRAR